MDICSNPLQSLFCQSKIRRDAEATVLRSAQPTRTPEPSLQLAVYESWVVQNGWKGQRISY